MKLISESLAVVNGELVSNRVYQLNEPIPFIQLNFVICQNEDSHTFDSTGRCTACGAHRKA